MKHIWTLLAVGVVVLASCTGGQTRQDIGMQGDTIALRHAENLTMVRCGHDMVLATLANPWDSTRTLHRYLLVPDTVTVEGSPLTALGLDDDVTVVRTPLRRAAVYTALHAALLIELGCLEQIGGVCDAEYIAAPEIRGRVESGAIHDYGYGLNPDLELIMDTHPDALMPSPFENAGYGGVEKLRIPIIECADYMETSPLGQAEWMRFYGLLFGQAERADSLFAEVEARYLAIRDDVDLDSRPRVLCDMLTGSTWYVPAGQSTMARMIADAGGDYVFAHLGGSGSVALTLETVLDKAETADVWIVKYNAPVDYTLDALAREHRGYAQLRAYREGRVYGCNTAHVPFFEESRFHPDRVLENLAALFADGADGRYYTRCR